MEFNSKIEIVRLQIRVKEQGTPATRDSKSQVKIWIDNKFKNASFIQSCFIVNRLSKQANLLLFFSFIRHLIGIITCGFYLIMT